MLNKLNMDINNFSLINSANIELNKLNIVAGVNGSGKSTSSKLLYCLLVANSKEGDYLANKSIHIRFKKLVEKIHSETDFDVLNLLNNLPELSDPKYSIGINENIQTLKRYIKNTSYIDNLIQIEDIININKNLNHRYFNVSNILFNSEFDFDDLDFDKNYVRFNGKNENYDFSHILSYNSDMDKTGFIINEGKLNYLNIENIIYIDSFSIFDIKNSNNYEFKNLPHHLQFLSKLINLNEKEYDVYDLEFNQKLDDFFEKIKDLIGGYVYYDKQKDEYKFKTNTTSYSMKNTASGVKQIGLIQYLLSNRTLTNNSYLIIDEIEANLHPEWQVKFAELLVLMIKELNINAYINSHSPHFIEAIEVFSVKYGLKDETNYFLTEKIGDNNKYNIKQIPYDYLYEIYDNLGDPYDIIDIVRGENILNGLE